MVEGHNLDDRITALEAGMTKAESVENADRIRKLTLTLNDLRNAERRNAINSAQQLAIRAQITGLSKPSGVEKLLGWGLTAGLAAATVHQGYATYQDFQAIPEALGRLKDAVLTFQPSINIPGMINQHNQAVDTAWRHISTITTQTAEHTRNTAIAGVGSMASHVVRPIARIRRLMGGF